MRLGAALALLLPLVMLAACKPSFDDRYGKAEHDIRKEAADVDGQLAKRNAASPQPPEPASSAASPEPTQSPR